MTKFAFPAIFLLVFCLPSQGQKIVPEFDYADFEAKAELAKWLYDYDMVAWDSTDSIYVNYPDEMDQVGAEWFCYEDSGKWHAVFGKYDRATNHYDQVFHFETNSDNSLVRVYDEVDTSLVNSYSRALQIAWIPVEPIRDSIGIDFNPFIRRNADQTMTVWIFPAFQPDGAAVFGGEFIYVIDPSGNRVLEDNSYLQKTFKWYPAGAPAEIFLDYSELDKPTLGAVFFLWYYKEYFPSIILEDKYYYTTVFKSEQGYSWMHIEKESHGQQ